MANKLFRIGLNELDFSFFLREGTICIPICFWVTWCFSDMKKERQLGISDIGDESTPIIITFNITFLVFELSIAYTRYYIHK